MGLDSLRYVLLGARAEGAVVAIERDGDLYVPAVRFSLPSGEAVEVRERGAGAPDFSVGDGVAVLYFPENPEDILLGAFERLWLPAASFFAVALVFGLAVRLSRWNRSRATGLRPRSTP